jgi:heme A synthase
MSAMWFYHDGRQQRGPLSQEDLIKALLAGQDPRRIPVWREGMAAWQDAGSVAEIRDWLPPPTPAPTPVADAEEIAKQYRRLVLLVGLQILIGVFQVPSQIEPSGAVGPFAGLVGLVAIVVVIATSVAAYKLSSRLGSGAPLAWAIAMFLPCVNVIVLLALSAKAQTWCRRYGIKVGLLGPTKESIEELRRRVWTSPFE